MLKDSSQQPPYIPPDFLEAFQVEQPKIYFLINLSSVHAASLLSHAVKPHSADIQISAQPRSAKILSPFLTRQKTPTKFTESRISLPVDCSSFRLPHNEKHSLELRAGELEKAVEVPPQPYSQVRFAPYSLTMENSLSSNISFLKIASTYEMFHAPLYEIRHMSRLANRQGCQNKTCT